jgi:hypothetical protein
VIRQSGHPESAPPSAVRSSRSERQAIRRSCALVARQSTLGIDLKLDTKVTDLLEVVRRFQAVFLAVGAQLSHRAYIPARAIVPYPRRARRARLGRRGRWPEADRRGERAGATAIPVGGAGYPAVLRPDRRIERRAVRDRGRPAPGVPDRCQRAPDVAVTLPLLLTAAIASYFVDAVIIGVIVALSVVTVSPVVGPS